MSEDIIIEKNSELNPYSLEDIVFEHRNKDYGAYDLRKRYKKYVLIAFFTSFTLISSAVVAPLIQAYYYKSKNVKKEIVTVTAELENVTNEEEAPPPPPPPPPPPAAIVQQTVFKIEVVEEVKEEEKVEIAIMDDQVVQDVAPPVEITVIQDEVKVVEEEEPAFVVVEEQATFLGGDLMAFRNWVASNVEYPEIAIENEVQGKVIVQFCVNSKGEICDIVVVRGVDPNLDNEAIRVLKKSPKWIPARQGGTPVKQKFTLPITFQLGN